MISRRILLAVIAAVTASLGFVSAACSSSGSGGGTGNGTGGGGGEAGADAAVPVESGIAPGSVKLAEGPCTQDVDCAPDARGTVACFIGGMGGGTGDGGGGSSAYCSLKCTPVGAANTTTCAAPFLEFCNMRGYCKLH